ncbi:hypothetical protein GPA25_21685 [Aromatoleum diolicum]|uniref:Uncharacterized protein n=2 Tax=Aromatoleum diolicum TaxID=75796 RepID=A0ABX1QJJ9_9RHOO|nr:hypothetical protein [Aromatoleum diolicum]
MHPIHDVDVILLLAVALASKRRPAELVEIMVAVDLIHGSIPPESKVVEAFHRLSTHGLLREEEGRFSLTTDAQSIMAGQPRKADMADRIFCIKEKLASWNPKAEQTPIVLTAEQLSAAIVAQRAAAAAAEKVVLVAKPKVPELGNKRAGHWRKPMSGRGRR